ncbi:methyl-accepting chemotaxis protein [Stutzerimonas azotifigens]|uniref:methyl-accepting chemotaxis protein n=1 Tax=Stutzerimonas azotifigens TaxID=291995 RepID=UPI0004131016|nr:methyl-accepting chemotaxis protein [Stutzerimonas azotifigens]
MNSLLYPAIGLMNRLSFGMKFSLISVLFFIPMLATNFYLVRGSYAQYVGTRIEQESLGVLGEALQLRRALEQWNDLAQLDALIGQSGNAQGLDARLSETRSAVGERLAALRPVGADAEQVAEFSARLDQLKAAVAAVQAEQALQSRVPMVGKLLGQSQVLIRLIASQSGLSQDAERDIRQMSELLTTVTPAISEALAQGRATGAGTFGQGFLNSNAGDSLDALVVELERLHGQYAAQLQEALASGPEARSRLEAIGAASLQSLKTSADLIQDEVIVANDLNQPWGRFFDAFSGEMAKTYRLNDATLDYLDSRLQARLEHKRLQMIGLLAALLLVFVLIVYLYAAFYVSTRQSLKSLGEVLSQVAAGDMTARFEVRSRDELGELGEVFNASVTQIHELIQRVGETAADVGRQAGQVERISGESNQAVATQRGRIEQVATAMNQMSATANEVAGSAAAAVDSARRVNDETASGRQLVEAQVSGIQRLAGEIDQSVSVINRLAGDSAAISQVLDVIKGIAEQTNLLALNAAIEAARAGEQGRGFAVVADEVRNLARRTQQSTEEIEQMIGRVQDGVDAAVRTMHASHQMTEATVSQSAQVRQALENILEAVGSIVGQSQQIAAAAEQQTAVAHDIDGNIVAINQAGERTAEGAGHTEQASRELSQLVGRLQQLIGAFRV